MMRRHAAFKLSDEKAKKSLRLCDFCGLAVVYRGLCFQNYAASLFAHRAACDVCLDRINHYPFLSLGIFKETEAIADIDKKGLFAFCIAGLS